MTQTILLVGATGMLGSQVATEILARPDTRVRLLLRPGALKDSKRQATVAPLIARGATTVDGDLADRASLDRATEEIDVVVSAVQGGPDAIIDGQVALAEAAKRNGARRILPSDFALDVFKSVPGENVMFDLRRAAAEAIATTGLQAVHVLNGAFMQVLMPGMGTVDAGKGVVSFWGDGTRPIEVTSVADTARMTARAALDPAVPAGKFAFAGDRISILDAATVLEKQTGRTFRRTSFGTEADLRTALAEAKNDKANPSKAVMLGYVLCMLTGNTALTDLQNGRYPDVILETFAEYAARAINH